MLGNFDAAAIMPNESLGTEAEYIVGKRHAKGADGRIWL